MKNFIQFSFPSMLREDIDILIARLNEIGFDGYEERSGMLIACISEEIFDEQAFNEVVEGRRFTKEILFPRNWNEEWESSFSPVIIDDFCSIRASFHEKVTSTEHDLIITPRMSFGTGHHATTSLMIQQMHDLDFRQKAVLDFGTGTGVLAILAEKLGASLIKAIDNDEWSIENARENIAENDCFKIDLEPADKLSFDIMFDIILANINKMVLLEHMSSIASYLKPDGRLIMSGLLHGDLPEIQQSMQTAGIAFLHVQEQQGWIVVAGKMI